MTPFPCGGPLTLTPCCMAHRLSKQATLAALSLEAHDLELAKPASNGAGGEGSDSLGPGGGVGTAGGAARGAGSRHGTGAGARSGGAGAVAGAGPEGRAVVVGLLPTPGVGEGLIAKASSLMLKQAVSGRGGGAGGGSTGAASGFGAGGAGSTGAAAAAPPEKKPLRIVVEDLFLCGTVETRDAVLATVAHIMSAVAYKPKFSQSYATAGGRSTVPPGAGAAAAGGPGGVTGGGGTAAAAAAGAAAGALKLPAGAKAGAAAGAAEAGRTLTPRPGLAASFKEPSPGGPWEGGKGPTDGPVVMPILAAVARNLFEAG